MKLIATPINDLLIIEPTVYGDDRGFFLESFQKDTFAALGLPTHFVQDNHSYSTQGTLRGLHFQKKQTQGKLVRVIQGEVFDVAVDLRKDSGTYGQTFSVILSGQNKRMFWVPEGFAHGFYVMSAGAHFVYKCTQPYSPEHEVSLCWNDSDLSINWPLVNKIEPMLSIKDKDGVSFSEVGCFINNIYVS